MNMGRQKASKCHNKRIKIDCIKKNKINIASYVMLRKITKINVIQ